MQDKESKDTQRVNEGTFRIIPCRQAILLGLVAGALWGAVLAELSYVWATHFTGLIFFLVEILFTVLRRFLSPGVVRLLSGPTQIVLLFAIWGGFSGAAFGIISRLLLRSRESTRPRVTLFSFISGLLVFFIIVGLGVIWIRVSLFVSHSYPDFSEFLSACGVTVTLVLIVISLLAAFASCESGWSREGRHSVAVAI